MININNTYHIKNKSEVMRNCGSKLFFLKIFVTIVSQTMGVKHLAAARMGLQIWCSKHDLELWYIYNMCTII